ncbi:MAG: FAD-dependent oxidoreductase [Ghiorsea sp.]
MTKQGVAVVGGGIAGLTAALRLAEQGYDVDLFEAAPALGGRTKSFYDEISATWVDNGPHMVVGAYAATIKLLQDAHALHHLSWQDSLNLPLWEQERGFFAMQAVSWLPVSLALLCAVAKMPKHKLSSVHAMLKVALTMKNRNAQQTVAQWLAEIKAPDILKQDMLEVLCLGVMNEPMASANAQTFARVLSTSFSSHKNARMGWFNQPLSQALIAPVAKKAEQAGVKIHLRQTIRDVSALKHDALILAMPAFARNRLLGIEQDVPTQAITNIHLWFSKPINIPSMMLGMLGTYSQWLFDLKAMVGEEGALHHYCVTVSADTLAFSQDTRLQRVLSELQGVCNEDLPPLMHHRIICEKRATVVVRNRPTLQLNKHVFDASESPNPGELPATIELAVLQGEKAARDANAYLNKCLTQ